MYQLFGKYFPNVVQLEQEFLQSVRETLYMAFWAALIAGVLGALLGVVLVNAGPGDILKSPPLYSVLEKIINVCHSVPLTIMLALIQPLMRILAGTTIDTIIALVLLVVGVIPLFARQIENVLLEANPGVIEAAGATGTGPLGIIFRVYLIGGLPSIVRISAITIINLIKLTAMAGMIGAGGLGNLTIIRGYNRFRTDVAFMVTSIVLIMVFISQAISNQLIRKTPH